MIRYRLLLLVIGVWLYGCNASSPPRSCAEILAQDLRTLLSEEKSSIEIQSRIAVIYDLPLEKIIAASQGFSWTKDGLVGTFITEAPVGASIKYLDRPPFAEAVQSCIGTPQKYRAWYHVTPASNYQPFLEFDMYFVQQGILARVVQEGGGNEPPRLDGKNPTVFFYYVQPSSAEETMEKLTFGISPEQITQIKPWPGNWEDIIVERAPGLR